MLTKVVASSAILIGGLQAILGLLAAFGVELTKAQGDAITGVTGALLLVLGAWAHPAIPFGNTTQQVPVPPPK